MAENAKGMNETATAAALAWNEIFGSHSHIHTVKMVCFCSNLTVPAGYRKQADVHSKIRTFGTYIHGKAE